MANIAIYTFNSSTDTLPVFNSGFTYNYTDVNNGNRTITRTITSDSLPTSISFKDKTGLVSLSYLDTSDVTSMSGMFNKCESLTSIDLSSFNTSNVTSMSEMFAKCYSLISVKGLDTIDTSKVTNMSYMFDNCDNLSTIEKINNMDTSSVTEMIEMFNSCYSLSSIDLSDWNTSNLVNAVRMFDACIGLRTANLSGLDFSSLVDAYYMFNNCTSLESVDLSGITTWARNLSIRSMFEGCSSLTTLKLGGLTQHITSCYDMFKGATALKSIIIDNSSIDSINQIINKLPTRTSSSYGTLTVPDLDESLNKTTANSKYWNVVKTPEYSFTMNTLKYFLNKLKEKFALSSEADFKVDKVDGKDLVTNDYTDEYAQLNNKIINDITISDKTDTEITLTFSGKNGDLSSIKIPYDKHKKSALFVDTSEKFACVESEESKIDYRYVSSLKDGNHSLVVEIIKSTGASTDYQESYTYDEIPNYYLYVPDEEDIALRMYFIDSENTMTNITYLEPKITYIIAEYIINEINDKAYPKCNDGSITNFITKDIQNEDNTFTRTVLAKEGVATSVNFSNAAWLTKINRIGAAITNMADAFYNCRKLTGDAACGSNVTDMSSAYRDCRNLNGSPACGPNVTDMSYAYYYCYNLKGSPVSGPNVTNMSCTYVNCHKLTGDPACGPNVTNMFYAYCNCSSLTGTPVCGNNVTDMAYAYQGCKKLTGSPACGPNVTTMFETYRNCSNLTGSPVCGDKVTNISCTYINCTSLTGSPVCGPNVIDMLGAYYGCTKLTGSPACGNNVKNMVESYYECISLTGSPVCGNNVTDMGRAYNNCTNLTGSPVCGPNVTNMANTYVNCHNLTGDAACGPNVTNMYNAYNGCTSLSGSPACGNNVTDFGFAYYNCINLTGPAIIGPNVIDSQYAYYNCSKITDAMIINGCTMIGKGTFSDCTSLRNVYIPASIINIGSNAFYNCTNLKKIDLKDANKLPNITNASFENINADCKITIPGMLYDSWSSSSAWETYRNNIEAYDTGKIIIDSDIKDSYYLVYNQTITLNLKAILFKEDTINVDVSFTDNNVSLNGYEIINNNEYLDTIELNISAGQIDSVTDAVITITSTDFVYSKNITIRVVETLPYSYTVESVDGAAYGFELNDAGYYESTNKNMHSTAAVCKVNIFNEGGFNVFIDVINYGESNWDYGLLSKINTTLSTGSGSSADNISQLQCDLRNSHGPEVQTIEYGVVEGFIYIKFRKDSSGSRGNDSLQFKVRFE